MKTSITNRDVSTFGVTQTHAFTIEANGKAFKALIDGLYSDKIRSVIRELWSNAFDSHVAAGCPYRPFLVQLPTVWEPVFKVRDYGTGLSHEDVMVLYTTVFRSTKEDTNSQVGKFGLGSKSPFAYVDTFTVTAFDGIHKRHYSAFIGDGYIPQIAFMGEEVCGEESGLEISFPAKVTDIPKFKEAAVTCLIGFKVEPEILGLDVRPSPKTVAMDGDGWVIYADRDFKAHARQGCVAYPLNSSAIPGISSQQSAMLSLPILIDFPIGELEITTNREALGYNHETCENIKRRLDSIMAVLADTLSAKIAGSKTLWEAKTNYDNLSHAGLNGSILTALRGRMQWRGNPLSATVDCSTVVEASKDQCKLTNRSMYDVRRYKKLKWEPTKYGRMNCSSTVVYFEDTDVKIPLAGERIKAHAQNAQGGEIAWIKGPGKSMAWKRAYVALGRPPLVMVADLPKPTVAQRISSRSVVSMKKLHAERLVDTSVDAEDGGIYFPMERGDIKCGDRTVTTRTMSQIRALLVDLGLIEDTEEIIGVPGTHKKMVIGKPEWRNIFTIAAEYVDANLDAQAIANVHAAASALNSKEDVLSKITEYVDKNKALLTTNGVFKSMLDGRDKLRDIVKNGTRHSKVSALAAHIGKGVPTMPPNVPALVSVDAVKTTYPMLALYMRDNSVWHVNADDVKILMEYVTTIDVASQIRHKRAA